jgi:hypothetical protein
VDIEHVVKEQRIAELRGYKCRIPDCRVDEFLSATSPHRWSIGSVVANSSDLFYLGGPLSFLNAACDAHACCYYYFTGDCHADAKRKICAGEQITTCYSGNDKKALTHTRMFIICAYHDCEEVVMHVGDAVK